MRPVTTVRPGAVLTATTGQLLAASPEQLRTVAKQIWPAIQPMPDHLREFLRLLSIEVSR